MNKVYLENGLTLAAALLVVIGVTAAASSALADESNPAYAATTEVNTAQDASLVNAESAAQTAASDALASVVRENRLDLDIRLVDHMSSAIAGDS